MSVRPHPGEETGSYRAAASNGKNSTRATGGQGMGISDTGGSARRPRRLMRRVLIVLGSLILVGAVAFGGLLLVTPSVGNAQSLARAQDRSHHVAFPGPPVPPRFEASIEATEDHRFGYEPGVDPFAIARVTASWLTGGGTADQGGATIYQQLAKLLYTRTRSGANIELEQISLAVKLWMSYSSRQVLQMYSDVAYFGNGDYGIAAASCGYFGVPPAEHVLAAGGAAGGPRPGAVRGRPAAASGPGEAARGACDRQAGGDRRDHPAAGPGGTSPAAIPPHRERGHRRQQLRGLARSAGSRCAA